MDASEQDALLRQAMKLVAAGEIEAFRTVAEALESRFERFFAQLGVPMADRDDLFQESCLRLYRAAGSYDPQRPFMPWALTVARRVMLNWHRALKPTIPLEKAHDVAAAQRSPGASAEVDIWPFARGRLSPVYYEVLWLCYGEDLGPTEIAAATGRTSVHVRVLLHRARGALASALKKAEAFHVPK